MATYSVDYADLWKDGRYFAQVKTTLPLSKRVITSAGTFGGDVFAVTAALLGGAYNLGHPDEKFNPHGPALRIYDCLSQILPKLSKQSEHFWKTAAYSLASMLATAKYPIRAQITHLVFWWARLGGLLGKTSLAERKGDPSECTLDGSPLEFSWVMPRGTDPSETTNRKIRFTIDPFHPEFGHRLAGGATLEWLWSESGGMGLVKRDGTPEWKDIIEKWLFPDLKNTGEIVNGCTYMIAFDLEPDGSIGLKSYYIPPFEPTATKKDSTKVTWHRLTQTPADKFAGLASQLHSTLGPSYQVLADYLSTDGKDAGLLPVMIACDIVKTEKNRLKLYFLSPKLKLKEIIYDLTLGGRLSGPMMDDAMANFKQFYAHLFPYAQDESSELVLETIHPETDDEGCIPRSGVRVMYYYEFFVGESVPYPKVYFFMDHFGKNDLETAKGTEAFLRSVGKKGEIGWLPQDLASAYPHRPLEKRNGLHTMVSFGTKPSGWEVTNYYSSELFASERCLSNSGSNA